MSEPTTDIAANPLPGWLGRFCRRWPGFSERYLSLDPRSLGLVRIYLGCLLLADLLRRVPLISTFYSNDGPLPNHVMLWRPVGDYHFSLFFLASLPGEAAFLFVLCGVCFLLFALGWKTRLMHVLSLIAICSLHNRQPLFEDGSEVTTRLLTFWTVFLPMGARFSLDALRSDRDHEPETRPAISLAVAAILLQISLLYTFNVLHKSGETWRNGTAVHYALHQDRIVSWLGWKLRPYVTPFASQLMSYSAVVTEALLPPLLLSPIATKLTRRVAIVLAIGLHLNFYALLNLGMFSFNMIGFYLLLLSDRDWLLFARLPRPGLFDKLENLGRNVLRALGPGPTAAPPNRLRQRMAALALQAREAVVVLFAVALGSQMMVENQALPDALRVRHQPLLFRLLVEYPRFYEGWSMFAPEVPKGDAMLYVDALTIDGRHVDPINELASRVSKLPLDGIPEYLNQGDSWCDYTMSVFDREEYQGTLADFIRAYPRRTHKRADRIVSFEVWLLEDDSPAPGHTQPTNTRRRLIFKE